MTHEEILRYKANMGVGYEIKCEDPEGNYINVTIVAKYPHFALVKSGNIKWCVNWVDVIRLNAR